MKTMKGIVLEVVVLNVKVTVAQTVKEIVEATIK